MLAGFPILGFLSIRWLGFQVAGVQFMLLGFLLVSFLTARLVFKGFEFFAVMDPLFTDFLSLLLGFQFIMLEGRMCFLMVGFMVVGFRLLEGLLVIIIMVGFQVALLIAPPMLLVSAQMHLDLIVKTLIAVQPSLSHFYHSCQPDDCENGMCFEVLGFDIMLDPLRAGVDRAARGAGRELRYSRTEAFLRAPGAAGAADAAAAEAPRRTPLEAARRAPPAAGAVPSAAAVVRALRSRGGPTSTSALHCSPKWLRSETVVGAALRQSGVPLTDQNIVQALVEAAGPAAKPPWAPSLEDVEAVREAASSGGAGAAQGLPAGAGEPELDVAAVVAAHGGSPTAREVVRALKLAAGADLGAPPPEVVGAALASSRVRATRENVLEALREAAGPGTGPPGEAALQAALAAAAAGGAARGPGAPAAGAPGAGGLSPVVLRLQAAQAQIDPSAGEPPPEVVGVALHVAGVPTTRESVARGLRQALGRPPSDGELRAALLAVAEEIASPGAYGAPLQAAPAPPGAAPQLRRDSRGGGPAAAGRRGPRRARGRRAPRGGGMALRAAGLEASRENVLRAFGEAGRRQGAAPPTLADVELAIASGAAPP
ncbi:unnamed protein product [Prorocentrum cordatum]|uniref:Uncharacterized protein n=1 Tax=Prorocentrum cordatum TaxID=2364126 RepID=A0ABN9TSW6_9DINO|nr:unnamed protein product [Polarella glacialis]